VLLCALACIVAAVACTPEPADLPQPKCELKPTDPRIEKVEVSCDGVDNDCDTLVDRLLPVDENRCSTGKKGACSQSWWVCRDGARVCDAPPPTAEVHDGVDNDCNGIIDDVPQGVSIEARARISVPPYLWKESPEIISAMRLILDQVGIPYDVDKGKDDFDGTFEHLADYSLIIMPGYLMGSVSEKKAKKLEEWVKQGGVLVWSKIVQGDWQNHLYELAGLLTSKKRTDIDTLRFATVPGTAYLEAAEEREYALSDDVEKRPVETFVYLPAPDTTAWSFIQAYAEGKNKGSAGVRRPIGHGAVYTLGVDLTAFTAMRCYVNCFDPGRDQMGMFLLGVFAEGCRGHVVRKHTVPGTEDSVLIPTHDVDAPDSHLPGKWGDPGALQMADMQKAEGVKGTYFITTDVVVNYYNPDMVTGLCKRGMCPEGGHSVQHFDWREFPVGDCSVTEATYNPKSPTLCGEVVVNLQIMREVMGQNADLRAWRTPYLEVSPSQFEILHEQGVRYDTSVGMGDVRTTLPFALDRYPYHQDIWQKQPLWEFPVNLEDGFGWYDANGKEHRLELHNGSWPRFRAEWTNAIVRNAANHTWNMLLVHPSMGVGEDVTSANIAVKIAAVRWAIQFAKAQGLRVAQMLEMGDFWAGRDPVQVYASYDEGKGYSGKIRVGGVDAPRFSLHFGDAIGQFVAEGAGEVEIAGGRVVFKNPLPASKIFSFTATVKAR